MEGLVMSTALRATRALEVRSKQSQAMVMASALLAVERLRAALEVRARAARREAERFMTEEECEGWGVSPAGHEPKVAWAMGGGFELGRREV